MDKVIVEKIYTAIASAAVTFLAGWALKKLWVSATGSEPPVPEDPEVPTHKALAWFLISGVGVGMAQLLLHRAVVKRLGFSKKKDKKAIA